MNPSRLREIAPWDWPEGTGSVLLRFLRDRKVDPSERLIAAELAGDLVVLDDEIARALLTAVADEDEGMEVRSTAAISLGPALEAFDIADDGESEALDAFGISVEPQLTRALFQEVQKSFRRLYLDTHAPTSVRRAVLEASVRAPQEWHPSAVREAHASGDHAWQVTAVSCMQHFPGFEREILAALASGDPDLEYEAVRAAGAREVTAAFEHIANLISGENVDKSLRLAAIEAIASIRPDEAPEHLWELADSDDEDIADAAQEALALLGAFVENDGDEEDDEDEE
jgi:HEAT repeats